MNKRGIATALVLAIIFGLTTVGLGTYIVYDNVKTSSVNENIESTIENEQTNDVKKEETTIPTDDLFAFMTSGEELYMLKVDNNALYVSINDNFPEQAGTAQYDSNRIKYEKVLDNVKRIKTLHIRTDILPSFYVILNDGTVKTVAFNVLTSNAPHEYSVSNIDTFNNYRVDDILSTEGEYDGFTKVIYEIKLNDGSIKKVEG